MISEEKFNKWFNVFVLGGMSVCVVLSCIFKIQEPGSRTALLILTAVGALMGVAGTVLSANGNILTFLFGFLDVAIYSVILFDSKMPTQFILHVGYMLPMNVIGFFQWRKKGASGKQKVKAQRLHGKKWLWYSLLFAGVFAVCFLVSSLMLQKAGEAQNTSKMVLDALVTTANIVALVMMTFAYMEQWYLWMTVNVASVVLWTVTLVTSPEAGYAVIPLVKYTFYTVNAVNGIRIWLKLSR